MAGRSSWRNLGSVMVVTLHVAAVASVLRSLAAPESLAGTLVWVPLTVAVAVFLSWPIGRAVASAFGPAGAGPGRTCPGCGRDEVRPVVPPGAGLFHPAMAYRCAGCLTTFGEGGGPVPAEASGIIYLSAPPDDDDIRFLEE